MDDNLISQFLDTPADADYGESALVKMRKVACYSDLCFRLYRTDCRMLSHITQYRSGHTGNTAVSYINNMPAEHHTCMQAFVNEKAAPELLDYKGDLVARLQDQIQNQACLRPCSCQQ